MLAPTREKLIIEPSAPFDFQKLLRFIQGFPPTQHEQVVGTDTLTKGLRLNQQTIAYDLRTLGTVESPRLELTVYADNPLTDDLLTAVEQRIRFFLSMDDDLSEFYRLAEQDSVFSAKVFSQLYGYRQVKFPSPFENAIWAVLAQRQSIVQARQMKQNLITHYSQPIQIGEKTFKAFPEVNDFWPVSAEILAECIGHERKALYLSHVIEAFAEISDDFLHSAPYTEVKNWLLNIKGIGEWSALFVLARGLGRMEQALTDDVISRFNQSMLQTARRIYSGISFADLQIRANYYGVWQGYWAHFLKAYSEIR